MLVRDDITAAELAKAKTDCEVAITAAIERFKECVGCVPARVEVSIVAHRPRGGPIDALMLIGVAVKLPEIAEAVIPNFLSPTPYAAEAIASARQSKDAPRDQ